MSHLTITNLRKSYGALEILKDVNLDIQSGEFIVFVGPSGCGKSTLLRCISGLEDITSGELRVGGQIINDLAPSKRGIAMVFQSYALYPHMTVYDNMAYSLKLQHAPKDVIRTKVHEAARKLQIESFLERFPKHLSGGQRQRVAIGRAIVRDPKIFLFDEPLSNLDAALRVATRLEIAKLKDSLPGTTMIYVTHDQVEAMTLADRIVVLNGGRVEQVGTPSELYENPKSIFVAGFIGSPKMNLITGPLAQSEEAHTLGIRPEHITLQADGLWEGKVMHVEYLGADTFVYVDMNLAEPFVIRMTGKLSDMTGNQIRFSPDRRHLHRFSEAGLPIESA